VVVAAPVPGDVVAATTTDAAGRFTAGGLAIDTTYRVVVAGQTIATVTTGSTDLALGTIVLARDVAPVPVPDAPSAPPFVGALPGAGPSLAYTGADAAAPLGLGVGLLALGLVLATGAAVRGRREHPAADRTE
jgi:hypothetical protein